MEGFEHVYNLPLTHGFSDLHFHHFLQLSLKALFDNFNYKVI